MLLEQEKRDLGLNLASSGSGALVVGNKAMERLVLNDPLKDELQEILKGKGDGIETLGNILRKDERDFDIVKDGLRIG